MKYLLVAITLLMSSTLFSQGEERIKAFKRAHITEALNLTSSEAERFWPVYNEFEEKMEALRKNRRRQVFQIIQGDMDGVTEAEADQLINKNLEFDAQQLEHNRNLVAELRKVISPKKILRLSRAEEEFKRMLLERMKNRQKRRNNK